MSKGASGGRQWPVVVSAKGEAVRAGSSAPTIGFWPAALGEHCYTDPLLQRPCICIFMHQLLAKCSLMSPYAPQDAPAVACCCCRSHVVCAHEAIRASRQPPGTAYTRNTRSRRASHVPTRLVRQSQPPAANKQVFASCSVQLHSSSPPATARYVFRLATSTM